MAVETVRKIDALTGTATQVVDFLSRNAGKTKVDIDDSALMIAVAGVDRLYVDDEILTLDGPVDKWDGRLRIIIKRDQDLDGLRASIFFYKTNKKAEIDMKSNPSWWRSQGDEGEYLFYTLTPVLDDIGFKGKGELVSHFEGIPNTSRFAYDTISGNFDLFSVSGISRLNIK